ncbi:phosphonate C-P lyase system protein PhnH [Mesorhizobium sp. BR1-1-16]|uniref:phosphonate C-P lyase system protein PhnH n=1 Tax=Mesorhizobium sp. BR1-1-16 TaxID=2876653 RepID=UPI001CCB7D6E|nr:phosphonate C-P lyase system protein PhnH [Mesorhizobium sp. BR1-1-16]MBZ9936179.1 phosphonate C-P lyase system protein PhnH [Mesorhizobium sp. BR1-1-16]
MLDVASTGFADPVLDAQAQFRALADALARPGSLRAFTPRLTPPVGFPAALASIALTVADHETAIWLDPAFAADPGIAVWLAFHSGARTTSDPSEAAFAFVADIRAMPPLAAFGLGDEAYPDRSTTLVIAVESLAEEGALVLSGPGIETDRRLGVTPWPEGFSAQFAANRALFPRGVDLILAAQGVIAALPRTTRIREA